MLERNNKIIDAIVAKADRECPGALALIGIYGSFLTGDVHEKSDLDLMILINDDRGYALSRTFIHEDAAIGHDLYCTTWEMLESDAKFTHPYISKLMDAKIVYCSDEAHLTRLEDLRRQAMTVDTRSAAEEALGEAERCFAKALLSDGMSSIRAYAGNMIHKILDAVSLLNHQYFKLGTRRIFDEIAKMEHAPENLQNLVYSIVSAENTVDLKAAISNLMQSAEDLFDPPLPCPEVIPGTYEEMFSNWRNKIYLAAEINDRYLAFDSMFGLDTMLKELGFSCDVLDKFDPNDLLASARAYDIVLENYRKEYDKAGITVQCYPDVDAFLEEYTKKETAH